jgi:hypothetical protein
VGRFVKRVLVVAAMMLALLLTPFALPVAIVVRWMNRAPGRTEWVSPVVRTASPDR